MQLKYISPEALDELKAQFEDNKQEILSPDRRWVENFLNERDGVIDINLEFDDVNLLCNGDFDTTDLQNTIEMYRKLKDLPLKVAADEKLWSWMALVKFWDYVYYRRKDDWYHEKKSTSKQKDNKAFNSFFYFYSESRSQVLNPMSRLWWAGHYTYDETRGDPFELTKFFLNNAFPSKVMLFQSSKITANKDIRLGILDGLKDWIEETKKEFKRDHFVEPIKYLNLMGGVSILDFYTREDIRNLTYEYLKENFA